MDFDKLFADYVKEADDALDEYAILPEEGYQKTVLEAMNYSIKAGGKRLRPVLMKAVYDAFGGTSDIIKPFMAAIEQIHTYSLVHDDLPAMDNDELRRGKPTTHIAYGEDMAILAGDALLNHAFESALEALDIDDANPAIIGKALKILAREAGIYGMVGGQVADVEAEDKSFDMDDNRLDFIFRHKTGALIRSSMTIGAVLAGADGNEIAKIADAAMKIGIAFQIQDDILDVIGDQELLGKPIGSDEKNNKKTYVTIHGLEQSKKDVAKISEEAIDILYNLPYDTEFLIRLAKMLIGRNK